MNNRRNRINELMSVDETCDAASKPRLSEATIDKPEAAVNW